MGGGFKLVHPLPCPNSSIVPLPMSGPRDTDWSKTLCCFSVPCGLAWVREEGAHPLSPAAAWPLHLPPFWTGQTEAG